MMTTIDNSEKAKNAIADFYKNKRRIDTASRAINLFQVIFTKDYSRILCLIKPEEQKIVFYPMTVEYIQFENLIKEAIGENNYELNTDILDLREAIEQVKRWNLREIKLQNISSDEPGTNVFAIKFIISQGELDRVIDLEQGPQRVYAKDTFTNIYFRLDNCTFYSENSTTAEIIKYRGFDKLEARIPPETQKLDDMVRIEYNVDDEIEKVNAYKKHNGEIDWEDGFAVVTLDKNLACFFYIGDENKIYFFDMNRSFGHFFYSAISKACEKMKNKKVGKVDAELVTEESIPEIIEVLSKKNFSIRDANLKVELKNFVLVGKTPEGDDFGVSFDLNHKTFVTGSQEVIDALGDSHDYTFRIVKR
jgi:hypothetical protein